MKINFLFSSINKKITKIIDPNQKIDDVLDEIILEDDSLNDLKFNFFLCNGNNIEKNKTFKENKLKNDNIIMIMTESNLNKSEISIESSPFRFKVVKCITNHSHVNLEKADLNAFIDRTFTVFQSLKNEYLLIFSYSEDYHNYSLICYDIIENKYKIIKDAHTERIFTCSHFLDKYNKRDLLITGAFDKTIKVRNISNNFEVIFKKIPDYIFKKNTYLLSEDLLSFKNKLYLITSAYEIYSTGYNILYYSLSNDDTGLFKNSKDNTNFLSTYYDKAPYIIAANCGNIKIFNFLNKKCIKIFSDNDNTINYLSIVIKSYKNEIGLIATSADGYLRIWDYNRPTIFLKKINTYTNTWLIGLELINDQFLLAACADGCIKEFDLYKEYVACSLPREKISDPLFTLKYINVNGKDYLFSHSHKGVIELWN